MLTVKSTDPGTVLLAETIKLAPDDRVLTLTADDPALLLGVAGKVASVDGYDINYTALKRARQQVVSRPNGAGITLHDDVFPAHDSTFDVALMSVPKGRDLARAQLWSALHALRPGGRLYIAGPTQGGAKSVIDDAAVLFGHSATLITKRRYRVAVAIRSDDLPVYPVEWGDDPTRPQQRTFATPGGPIAVMTMPGIFSWQQLDDGTALLLEHLEFSPDQAVLDVGCGNGILGLAAARTAKRVIMSDDNLLAVRCARAGVELNGLTNATVEPGDVYADLTGQHFDLIVSNPPFHQEFDVNTNVAHRIMRDAKPMLRAGGRLVIVANAFLKYEDVMAQHLSKARIVVRSSRYIVIEGERVN